MSEQSLVAKLGLRHGVLGSFADLLVAVPLADNDLDPAAHTDASRIGWYADRTFGAEKLGFVVMGVETLAVSTLGIDVTGVASASNLKRGVGTPEGVVTGVVGDVYQRLDGGSASTFYVKESGTGNTGWTAVGTGGTPGGVTTSVQFNNAGVFDGTSDFTYDHITNTVTITDGYVSSVRTGSNSEVFGAGAGVVLTGSGNTILGSGAAALIIGSTGFVAIGHHSMSSASAGQYCTAIGGNTLLSNTSGSANIALGYNAGYTNTAGSHTLFIGDISQDATAYAINTITIASSVAHGPTMSNKMIFGDDVRFTGDIKSINNVATAWPALQGAADTLLLNDGAGNLSWFNADTRYLRDDVWIIDHDPDENYGEILIDVDNNQPVYNTEADDPVPTPTPLGAFSQIGADATISGMLLDGNLLYVGGLFGNVTDSSGTHTRNFAACLNITTGLWTSWNPNVGGSSVLSFAKDGSNIYIGGSFTTVGGVGRVNLAKVDTATGALQSWVMAANFDGSVTGIALNAGIVYVSGQFENVGATRRNYFAAIDNSTGVLTSWDAGANNPPFGAFPYGLTPLFDVPNGKMYLAGGFLSLHGSSSFYVGKVSISAGAYDSTFASGFPFNAPSTEASILLSWFGTILVGQWAGFSGASGFVLRVNASDGSVDARFGVTPTFNGEFTNTMTWDPNGDQLSTIYVGGNFTSLNGISRSNLCTINPTNGNPEGTWAPNPNGTISAIQYISGYIIATGAFTTIGGKTRNRIALIDATTGAVS